MTFVDYECKTCGEKKEVKFEWLKDITKTHPCVCGQEMVRDYSPVGIKFVGPGFYVNDSKAK
jgi:predicted nucleic acid-binding Zn ribbon protein